MKNNAPAVLLSIQPKWCALIGVWAKTIEIRKTKPQIEAPFKCYIYCTSIKTLPLKDYVDIHIITGGKIDDWHSKVLGEFGLTRPPQSWCYVKELTK